MPYGSQYLIRRAQIRIAVARKLLLMAQRTDIYLPKGIQVTSKLSEDGNRKQVHPEASSPDKTTSRRASTMKRSTTLSERALSTTRVDFEGSDAEKLESALTSAVAKAIAPLAIALKRVEGQVAGLHSRLDDER